LTDTTDLLARTDDADGVDRGIRELLH
jgi:hypothetical protein